MDTMTARKRLEETRDELDRSIMVLQVDQPLEERAEFPDPADAGSNLSEIERTEAVIDVAKQQLAEVLDALHRISEGSYGTCADCGKPIPEGRLDAKPEAARCVACQARRDRQRR
ncbi:MAG: TraR/DksA family transcriptional regulator [Streptosporangiaceae bacterium]